jgi:hypothetical protein
MYTKKEVHTLGRGYGLFSIDMFGNFVECPTMTSILLVGEGLAPPAVSKIYELPVFLTNFGRGKPLPYLGIT